MHLKRSVSIALVLATLAAGLLTSSPVGAASGDFPYGVAAQARRNTAILWTNTGGPGAYVWEVSRSNSFGVLADTGVAQARPGHDFTIKVTANGLRPRTRYFYRFRLQNQPVASEIGRFRTLPRATAPWQYRIALTGDSDILWDPTTEPADPSRWGPEITDPMQILDRVQEENADFFIYMGDTIYSDSETGAPLAATLTEKWDKYKGNREANTQNLLRTTSTWALWDDHEVVNDFDGVELAQSDSNLLRAGIDAFNDYWPIAEGRYYRKVDLGSNTDILFLDERTYRTQSADEPSSPCRDENGDLDFAPTMPQSDRDEFPGGALPPASQACLDHINDPSRTMLGKTQLSWLKENLRRSNAKWKLIVNEVPIQQLFVLPYDRWEGYAAERRNLLNFIKNRGIKGVVFLTTDLHANIGGKVFVDTTQPGAAVADEVITGPIQTCTLRCEIDGIVFPGAGSIFKSFLLSRSYYQGAKRPHCRQIDAFAYAMISQTADDSLKIQYKSAVPGTTGGAPLVNDCDPKTLKG